MNIWCHLTQLLKSTAKSGTASCSCLIRGHIWFLMISFDLIIKFTWAHEVVGLFLNHRNSFFFSIKFLTFFLSYWIVFLLMTYQFPCLSFFYHYAFFSNLLLTFFDFSSCFYRFSLLPIDVIFFNQFNLTCLWMAFQRNWFAKKHW